MRVRLISWIATSLVTTLFAQTSLASEQIDWTGFYVGLNAGAALGTAKMDFDPSGSFLGPVAGDIRDGNFWRGTRDLDSTSMTGGLQAGYQKKHDNLLFGLEAEINYLGLRDDSSVTATVPVSGTPYRLDQSVQTDFFASLRPRLGYVPESFSGDLLLFATGGVTLTHAQIKQKFTQLNNTYSSQGLSEDRMLIGWVAGGGLEYALSQQWSVKAEYLYASLGSVESASSPGSAGFTAFTTNNQADLTAHIIRVGTAFHF